jgi:rod shape determining protein RodA
MVKKGSSMPDLNLRLYRYFDWINFFLVYLLAGCGLVLVFSATYTPEIPYSIFFKKQATGLIIGLFIYCIFCSVDYRHLMRWGYFAYFGVIGLLIFTLIKGSIGMGGQRWIDLFFFKIQPSELAKLFFPPYIAYHFFSRKAADAGSLRTFGPVLAILAISALLIMKQPDLGTALIILFSGALLLWLGGLSNRFFIICMVVGSLSTPILWHVLKPYQRKRIEVFLGQGDARKERYQVEQATIAIGSGGFWGKGFMQGTQNKLRFLPESRTDFIFAVIGEEFGFLGTMSLLLLYALLIMRIWLQIIRIKAPFIQLLAIGLLAHIFLSALINICMVLNLLPVVGIPLPLISYGLSNLWVTLASFGWLQGIAMRNRE